MDHGDCTIIRHPGDDHRSKGRVSFIDINDWKEREEEVASFSSFVSDAIGYKSQISPEEYARRYLNDPIEYFEEQVAEGGQGVWRFVSTHPDMDHLSGLSRLVSTHDFSVLWDIDHNKSLSQGDSWPPQCEYEDWEIYSDIRNNNTDHQALQPTRGAEQKYWKEDNIDILHPSPSFVREINEDNEGRKQDVYNDISYVLKLNTRAGAVLLPGDAENDAWEEILQHHGEEVLSDVRILKAAHHGRKDGFHNEAVSAMDPEYVIVSVGKKDSADAYEDYYRVCSDDTEIISTRQYGSITAIISKRGAMTVTKEVPDGIFDLPN